MIRVSGFAYLEKMRVNEVGVAGKDILNPEWHDFHQHNAAEYCITCDLHAV